MKRISSIVFLLFTSLLIKAQSLDDFSATISHTVTYDESFQPTLNLTLKNVSDKVITTIEIVINYKTIDTEWDAPYVRKTVQVRIDPGKESTAHIRTSAEIRGHKPSGFYLSRIRFEDGSICK